MPLYEYQCRACGEKSEVLQRFSDPPLAACPKCGGEVKKLLSSPAFQFKGTGWYATDYAGKKGGEGSGGKAEGDGAKGDKAEKAEKAETSTSTSETKRDSKPDAKPDAAKPKTAAPASKD